MHLLLLFQTSFEVDLRQRGVMYKKDLQTTRITILEWILVLFFLMASPVFSASNLPLLSGTLRTFQVHACDGDELKIECSPNTVISIYFAQYGRQVPSYQLCPPEGVSDIMQATANETTNCVASEALRYDFLQAVEEACREQRICKVKTAPHTFGVDPCPNVRKYAEVAYKCRPNTFSNKIVCEGDRLRLLCPKHLRIVIYSAAFGATHYGVPECPQLNPDAEVEDCQVSYATETVMSSCHGRRKCSVGADVGTFGSPGCPMGTKLFLKVVHTCVPREVLKHLDLGGSEESGKDQEDSDYKGFIEESQYIPAATVNSPPDFYLPHFKSLATDKPQSAEDMKGMIDIQTTVKTDMQSDENSGEDGDANTTALDSDQKVVGFLTEWVSAYNYIKENKGKFILYLSLSLSVGVVAFLAVLTTKYYVTRSRNRQRRAKPPIPESPPIGSCSPFGEDCTDLDHFDNPNRMQDSGVEVVRYATRSSLKRAQAHQDDDEDKGYPRAPVRALNNYYYS